MRKLAIFTAVIGLSGLATTASYAAYGNLTDNGTTITYNGGNTSGDSESFSFNGSPFVQPANGGSAAGGSQASSLPLTYVIQDIAPGQTINGNASPFSVWFKFNGSVVAGFTETYSANKATVVYNDYAAEGLTAPTPGAGATIINLNANGNGSSGFGASGASFFAPVTLSNVGVNANVPEPASLGLFAMGISVLGLRLRHRRQA